MAGYIRQSTFVDGDTITAALFNNEYNQLVNAFSNTSGHKHDGTTAEGPVIGLIGDAGETSPNNKVLIDTTNNYIEFYVEVSSAPVQQLYIADGAIIPVTDSDIDLGTTSLRFKDTYTDTVTTTGNVSIGGDLTVTGSATISGNLTFGDADTDSINLAAEIDSHIVPNTDNTYDLGTTTKEWRNLYIDGTANIDSLIADTADINGGTIDGATIATSDITVGAGKTLNVSAGTLTLADNQISGDKVEGGTIAATTITTLTSTTGNITNVNATTVDSTNLEVTNLKAKDGTSAGSIADTTGVVTLASSVLTTTDINGGTIDGVTIGGSSAGAVTFTDLSDGTITIAGFADEDNMVSNSATLLPTQQSVKAYVDSQVTAQDLDFAGDTGGALSIDLDSESLTIAGGTGIDTSGATNTLTVAIDSTVATLTGTQTLTNKTLTSPDVNTPDIDGGTIDSTIIGGTTPAAGTFTTLTANTSITGTLATAAQPNITSVGTLTGLTTTGDINFGDNDKAVFGAGSDLQIYHDGSNSYIEDAGTGSLIIEGTNLNLRANDNSRYLVGTDGSGGSTALYHPDGDSIKLATTSTGIDVTGEVESDTAHFGTGTGTGTIIADEVVVSGTGSTGLTIHSPDANNATLVFGSTTDNDYAFIQGYYNSGSPFIRTSILGSEVTKVTSSGIDVTGTVTSDGIVHTGDSDTYIKFLTNRIYSDVGGNRLLDLQSATSELNSVGSVEFNTGTSLLKRLNIASNGDISFYDDTGTSQALYWDASAESLGIGTTSPVSYQTGAVLNVGNTTDTYSQINLTSSTSGKNYIGFGDATSGNGRYQGLITYDHSANEMGFGTIASTSYQMVIDSSGNVGIGTTSPAASLHTSGGVAAGKFESTGSTYVDIDNGTVTGRLQTISSVFNIGTATAGTSLAFKSGNGTEAMRINSAGDVGIGVTNPTQKLHIKDADYTYLQIEAGTTGHGAIINLGDSTDADYGSITQFASASGEGGRMRFIAGTTETMNLRGGNVGIGTSSPAAPLDVRTSTGDLAYFIPTTTGHGSTYISSSSNKAEIGTGLTSTEFSIRSKGNGGFLTFDTSGTERARIDTSGNVLVGTTVAPQGTGFVVNSGISSSTTTAIEIQQATNGANKAAAALGVAIQNGGESTNAADLIFKTASGGSLAEAMRINADRAVLIGKTGENAAVAGTILNDTGDTYITAEGSQGRVLYLNRLTSDGTILDFRKDGSTVGSITADNGYLGIGKGDTGLLFQDVNDAIQPRSTTSLVNRDAAIDLGVAGGRFKDLYLSGGAYLGGTGAANKLDDYEEGTWTPVLKRDGSTNNATITVSGEARYTKVGRMVTVSFYLSAIDYSAVTDGTNAIITGFPFSGASTWYSGSIGYGTSTNASYTTWIMSTLTGYFLNSNNNGFRNGTVDLNRGMFTITYQTT